MSDEPATSETPPVDAATPAEGVAAPVADAAKGLSPKAEFEKIPVAEVMDRDCPKIEIEKTVGDLWDLMEEKQLDVLPIVEDEKRVVRMVTRNNIEIMKSVFFDAPGMEERRSRLMCLPLNVVNQGQELKSIKASETLDKALDLMIKNKIHSLPVVDDAGLLQGLLTSHGIFAKLLS